MIKLDELLNNYENPEWQIIDTQSDDEYNGIDNADNRRAGHIPSALHLEWNSMLKAHDNDVFLMRPPNEMEELLREKGFLETEQLLYTVKLV